MLKLAGFNSTIYSFNKKMGVSFTPIDRQQKPKPCQERLCRTIPMCIWETERNEIFFGGWIVGGLCVVDRLVEALAGLCSCLYRGDTVLPPL